MELMLNIAWVLLVLPAYWLWREARTARNGGAQGPFHNLLALGCMLVLLFPVVSASDDVCAMQDCTEESARTVRQANCDKPSGLKWQASPALPGAARVVNENSEAWEVFPAVSLFQPAAPAVKRPSRGPPLNSSLA